MRSIDMTLPPDKRPSIRAVMGRINPGTQKLNEVIVAQIKRWNLEGMTSKAIHEEVRKRGYRVTIGTIYDINGGRAWGSVQP